ncbi:hypothetical protein [Thiomonas sp.]
MRQLDEDVLEETLAQFMQDRIENGALALEDLPVRLVRYGLMRRDDFLAEMQERMNHAREADESLAAQRAP